jgi:hypothetical protein
MVPSAKRSVKSSQHVAEKKDDKELAAKLKIVSEKQVLETQLRQVLLIKGSKILPEDCKSRRPAVKSERCVELFRILEERGFGNVMKSSRSYFFVKKPQEEVEEDETLSTQLQDLGLTIQSYGSSFQKV